jgi:tetratricopeptide (TPR) repeat protein
MSRVGNNELPRPNDEWKTPTGHSSFVIRHSSFLFIFILLLCFVGTPLAGQGQSAEALIRDALAAYQSGQLEVAIEKLRQARKAAPSNPNARLYLGILLYQKDSASMEAQSLMESVLDRYPTNSDLLLRLTDSYLATHNEGKLPSFLERSQKAMSADDRLAFNMVYLLVRYAQLETADRELSRLSERLHSRLAGDEGQLKGVSRGDTLAQALSEVSFVRGLIAATLGKRDEAMEQFQAADRGDFPPENSPQMKMLAEALFRLEDYALSAQAYQTYLRHFPQDDEARLQLAIAFCSSSSFTRAQEQLGQLYGKSPAMPQVNYYLGMVLLEAKKHDEARRHFESELKIDPASYPSMAELAYLDYTRGDNDKCRQRLQRAAALNPRFPDTNYVYGLLYNRLGKYDLAVKSLESAVHENPKHIKAQFQLSIAYRRIGNEAKAKEHADIYSNLLESYKTKSLSEDPRKK